MMTRAALVLFAFIGLALSGPLEAASPGRTAMKCRGGLDAKTESPDRSLLIWHLAAPVGQPSPDELAPYHCRWEEPRELPADAAPYVALRACCVPGDNAVLLLRILTGTPFAL